MSYEDAMPEPEDWLNMVPIDLLRSIKVDLHEPVPVDLLHSADYFNEVQAVYFDLLHVQHSHESPVELYDKDRFNGESLMSILMAPRQHCDMEIVEDLAYRVNKLEEFLIPLIGVEKTRQIGEYNE